MEAANSAWAYIDASDGAQAVRLSLERKDTGHKVYLVANEDTVMDTPTAELVGTVFPSVRYTPTAGAGEHATLLSIEKARRELGFAPRNGWRGKIM